MIDRHLARLFIAFCGLAAVGVAVFSHAVMRTDMGDFLPPSRTPAARFLAEELQTGPASNLALMAIDGAAPEHLARASHALVERLRSSQHFSLVTNGQHGLSESELKILFDYRYALSPRVTPEAFAPPALRRGLEATLAGLASSAAPLLKRTAFADPTGEFLEVVRQWAPAREPRQVMGAWFAETSDRALILARSRAAGLDLESQETAHDAIVSAFEAVRGDSGMRLALSGAPVFAVEISRDIRREMTIIGGLALAFVGAIVLFWVRSPRLLLVVSVPLAAATIVATAVVQWAFGFVHGITLGFGMTMLGVVADYPIHFLGHRSAGEAPISAIRRVWPTIFLGAATTAIGFGAMLVSSFPGLSQLAVFAVAGLIVGAAVTRWALPYFVPTEAPVPHRGVTSIPADRFGRWRWGALALPFIAAIYLASATGEFWERDLARLSPVPRARQEQDRELRAQLGAPDVRHLIAVRGATTDRALQTSEALVPRLEKLVAAKTISSYEMAARYLPSAATQMARLAAILPPDTLEAGLSEALAGLPFRDDAFAPFLADTVSAKRRGVLTYDAVMGTALGARVEPFLFTGQEGWTAVVALGGIQDAKSLGKALSDLDGESGVYVDVKSETEAIVLSYLGETTFALWLGAVALLIALFAGLRRISLVVRTVLPLASTIVVTAAILHAIGIRLTLFHVAALLLVVGLSIDYALFANRSTVDASEWSRTMHTLIVCAATTATAFGLLAFSNAPILNGIGYTVAIGAFCAIAFSCLFARRPGADRST